MKYILNKETWESILTGGLLLSVYSLVTGEEFGAILLALFYTTEFLIIMNNISYSLKSLENTLRRKRLIGSIFILVLGGWYTLTYIYLVKNGAV